MFLYATLGIFAPALEILVTTSEKPPYARYAFLNPYNLSLLVGAGVAASATGNWGVAVAAAVAETVWMLFAPDSKVLRATWFDPKFASQKRLRIADIRGDKYRALTVPDQERAQRFWDATRRVEQLANENPSMTAELVRTEIAKLDELYDDFLELGRTAGQGETHLARTNYAELNNLWNQYTGQVEHFQASDKRHAIAQQNLEVLRERKKRIEDLASSTQAARGQMDLLDNTLRLLGDEIMAMTAPSELGARLDELREGVSAIRETSKDLSSNMLESFDEELAESETKQAQR
jgi:hypothetical protein